MNNNNLPINKPIYVSRHSNHPPNVLKNIPSGINRRLSAISANETIFDQTAPLYQAELDRNGYNYRLKFDPPQGVGGKKTRRKKKRIVWFNPPYSMDVKTDVGAKFLKIIDRCFPPGSILHPVLNRKTLKLSYRCLPNIGSIIAGHNCKLLSNFEGRKNVQTPTCNCQKKEDCPVPGKCTLKNVMYHTTVEVGPSGTQPTHSRRDGLATRVILGMYT